MNSTYTFTLVLKGIDRITDELEEAIFDAGCGDAMLYTTKNIVFLEFDRVSSSLKKAILSAISDVEQIDRVKVASIEPGDLVTEAEIARRGGLSREYIRLLALGKRGSGTFPLPVSGATSKTRIYSWVDISAWLTNEKKIDNRKEFRHATILQRINMGLYERKKTNGGNVPLYLLKSQARNRKLNI